MQHQRNAGRQNDTTVEQCKEELAWLKNHAKSLQHKGMPLEFGHIVASLSPQGLHLRAERCRSFHRCPRHNSRSLQSKKCNFPGQNLSEF